MDGKSVRWGRAFRADSCPREKALPSLATPAARPDRPHLTAAQGPRKSSAHPARTPRKTGERAWRNAHGIILQNAKPTSRMPICYALTSDPVTGYASFAESCAASMTQLQAQALAHE